jgi:hypothetical protein
MISMESPIHAVREAADPPQSDLPPAFVFGRDGGFTVRSGQHRMSEMGRNLSVRLAAML